MRLMLWWWATRLLVFLAINSAIAAIWAPGPWWKWLLTSVLLIIAAAASSNAFDAEFEREKKRHL